MSYPESVVRHLLMQLVILVVVAMLAAWWFCWPSNMIAEDWQTLPKLVIGRPISKGPWHPGDGDNR
jgi:hypothetical protein